MTIKHNYRSIILFYTSLIILFLILATIITTYSLGYRYNFTRHQIVKTGILRLSPTTTDMEISIDDEKVKQSIVKKNTEIPNLLPGDYQISIKKTGHQTWKKTITIEPNKITNENNILLLPIEPKIEDIAIIKQYASNQNLSLSAFVNIDKIQIINTTSQQISSYPQIKLLDDTQLKWISDQTLAVISKNEKENLIYTINYNNSNVSSNSIDQDIEINNVIGHLPLQPNIILLFKDQQIQQFDINKEYTPTLYINNVYLPNIINSNLYYYSPNDEQTNQENQITSTNLTYNSTTKYDTEGEITSLFVTNPANFLIVNANNNNSFQILSISNYQSKSNQIIPLEINHIDYEPLSSSLLIKTNNEINIVDLTKYPDYTSKTILRLTEKIHQSWWLDSNNILYTIDNNIYRINEDGFNNQTIHSFTSQVEILGISNQNIIVVTENENQKLLQNITIAEKTNSLALLPLQND